MKKTKIAILMAGLMLTTNILCNTFIVSATVKLNENISKLSEENEIIDIRVALYADEEENEEFHSEFRRTCEGFSGWHQINKDGFGNQTNVGSRSMEVFNDSLIIGTANYDLHGGALHFDHSWSLSEFFYEYVINQTFTYKNFKSNGCEIWKYDGYETCPLVSDDVESVMGAGFGDKNNIEVGFIQSFKDYVYVGVRNEIEGCQVWRSNDLEQWDQVLSAGFSNKFNTWAMVVRVFDDYLYMGTLNFEDGCEIFRTSDGVNWEVVVGTDASMSSGFGSSDNFYAWSMCVYDSALYVGTANIEGGGGELWKTTDGISWEPVIAYDNWIQARSHGALCPRGIARGDFMFRGGIRDMIVYKDELYLGFTAEDMFFGLEIEISPFNLVLSYRQGFLSFHPIRRMLSLGCEIWKYNASTDKLDRVVGGLFGGNTSGGFGDSRNDYPWSMEIYNDELYVGTGHPDPVNILLKRNKLFDWQISAPTLTGGAEIWKFDGSYWTQVIGEKASENDGDVTDSGFGDQFNGGFRDLKSFNGNLFVATMNGKNGTEIWRYRPN